MDKYCIVTVVAIKPGDILALTGQIPGLLYQILV